MVLTGDTTALQVAEIPCLVLEKGVSGKMDCWGWDFCIPACSCSETVEYKSLFYNAILQLLYPQLCVIPTQCVIELCNSLSQ